MTVAWNLDQSLVWLAARNSDFVKEPGDWTWTAFLTHISKNECWDLAHDVRADKPKPEERVEYFDGERWGDDNLKMEPAEAEETLIEALRHGRLCNLGDEADSDRRKYVGARVALGLDSAALVSVGGKPIPVRLEAAEMMRVFPADNTNADTGQETASSPESSVAPGSSATPNRRLSRQYIELLFRERVAAFEAEGRRPKSVADMAFLMGLGCKRDEAREIRKAIAPADWQGPGVHRKD
jgi:hypothetical protein